MIAKAIIYKREDEYEGVNAHEVEINNVNNFRAYNMNECPEDAIIGRDLFDGYDYINAVKYGLKLAKDGYIDIEIEVKPMEEY